jgi:hypothetical protein
MNGLAIALCALLGAVEFPMTSTGRLGVFKFFSSDVEHFVFSEIAARVTALRAGDFETRLGLEMDTYMGESWNNPDMKFNIYGGHWNISFELAWLTGWGEARLYTDHECFHNIDMEDTLSEYMNNVKLGAVYYPDSFGQPDRPQFLPAGHPSGWLSLGLYRPRGDGFQKGHDFDWSIQAQADMPLAAWHRWSGGLRYRPELFFHNDGDTSSRHRVEAYARYMPGSTAVEFHLTHYPVDTQPFRQLEGETYLGLRFLW